MAHFAELNENNEVIQVIVIDNADILDENGVESEARGISKCQELLGGTWIQTSYNGTIRKNYAGSGAVYDSNRDAFIYPQVYASWSLDEDTCQWVPPVPRPIGGRYKWSEPTVSWVLQE